MKTRTLVSILILVLVALAIIGSCAKRKKAISIEDAMKQFEGVYVNTEYSRFVDLHAQKRVIILDGKIEAYPKVTNESYLYKGEYEIEKSWSDSTGNIYGTVDVKWLDGLTTLELWKLDKARNTFEVNGKIFYPHQDVIHEHPTKIDPKFETLGKLFYCIWYRQE